MKQPDFQDDALRAVWRRMWWHARWQRLPNSPWIIGLDGLFFEVPRRLGSAALVFYQGSSEPEVAEFIQSFLEPGMTFYDVGAHLGEYALLAARSVGEAGTVHAFEPNSELAPVVLRNVRRNGFTNCSVSSVAIGAMQARVVLEVSGDPAEGWIRTSDESAIERIGPDRGTQERVPVITLDEYWRQTGARDVHLIKIDIEGAELLALRGAAELLAQPQSPVVVFECLPHLMPRFGYGYADLLDYMHQRGYQLYELTGVRGARFLAPMHGRPTQANIVAAKDGPALGHLKWAAREARSEPVYMGQP
jgi:FkbM family methyltransferase